MPRSIKKRMPKDLLSTLDPDIDFVKVDPSTDDLVIGVAYETNILYLSEQDLLTLLTFLRKEKQQ